MTLPTWHDLPQELQQCIFLMCHPRERRLFRHLNKACRSQACHHFIKRLSLAASDLVLGTLYAANQTLTQHFSNLHTLILLVAVSMDDLRLVGQSSGLTCLHCSNNDGFTDAYAAALAIQFPNIQALNLTCLSYIHHDALEGLSTLTRLTALSVRPDPHDSSAMLPCALLDYVPAELSSLKSLDMTRLYRHYYSPSSSFPMHLTQLTRLVLHNPGYEAVFVGWAAFLAPLSQLTGLQHLELPCEDSEPALWLQSLTNLTYLNLACESIDLEHLAIEEGPVFPHLQRLTCYTLAGQGQVLPSCSCLEVASLCTEQDVAAALQLCPRVQRLSIRVPEGPDAVPELVDMTQAVSAVQAKVMCNPHSESFISVVAALNQFRFWGNLRAVRVIMFDQLQSYIEHMIHGFCHVTSLYINGMATTQEDTLAVCAGLPLMREFVLDDLRASNPPLSGSPSECAQLLASGPLATRQLRISITALLDVQVVQLNVALQDIGCDNIRIDNQDNFELW